MAAFFKQYNEVSGSINGGEFLDQLCDYQFLKKSGECMRSYKKIIPKRKSLHILYSEDCYSSIQS